MTIPQSACERVDPPAQTTAGRSPPGDRPAWGDRFSLSAALLLCVLHGAAIWIAMGGREGMRNGWPPLQVDHGIHYHHGLVARHFLRTTGMTAGYDPGFMSGYALSIASDLSSTLSDLVMLASGDHPALGYKVHVFGAAALTPWLVGLAAIAWKARPTAVLVSVLLYLVYFWTDFPVKYVGMGMLNYLLSVPLGLLAVAGLASYCERGGFGRWLRASAAGSAVFLVHVTSPMLVGPAGSLAYAVAVVRARRAGRAFPASRHVGFWAIAPVILAANAFWLLPGFFLASTVGGAQVAFAHSGEGVWGRFGEMFWIAPPIQVALLGLAPLGLAVLGRRAAVAAAGLGAFFAAGFGWGYLAGAFPSLDALQPGRHTYACYSAACVAAGVGLDEVRERLRPARLDGWFVVALLLAGIRIFVPALDESVRARVVAPEPFLSSRPTPLMVWVVNKVRTHVKPGQRLLFEETGLGAPGGIDPFRNRHCSPILPQMTGVEVIGGPYLHTTVTTNFTQFGENKLFEKEDWGRDWFVRYARLYRPAAICCRSTKARAFCFANPDLVRVVEDDGMFLIGLVIGFDGATVRGSARVEAGPNRLVVRDAVADPGGDGLVVLRYHAVPYLRADPPVAIERVFLEGDPVPFIALRPSAGPVTIEMVLPPRARKRR